MQIIRNLVLDRGAWRIIQIDVRNPSTAVGDIAVEDENILVLPVAGVFAKHDGPRHKAVGTPSDGMFIAAHHAYRLSFPGGIGDRCLTIRFGDDALSAIAPMPRPLNRLAKPLLLPARLLMLRNVLWRRFQYSDLDDLELDELSGMLVETVLRLEHDVGAPRFDTQPPHRAIEAVKEAVAIDPAHKWSLAELGHLAHVSPYHLSRRFRQATGASIYEYVLRARLAFSLDLLVSTPLDLTNIALDAGFSSHSHFTARFRGFFGTTPTRFRQTVSTSMFGQMRRIVTATR